MNRAVWLAAATAILPMATLVAAETPRPAARVFDPPPTPLMLTRTLRHMMHDGTAIVTRRAYRVRFVRDGDGFRLDGTLAEVTVAAPPGLEALAALERLRPDPGLFPMRLDAAGMVLPTIDPAPADPEPSPQQRQAIGAASADIGRMKLAADAAAQAQGFVARFEARPYRTAWPLDLFRPAPGMRSDRRTIPLDGGLQGEVTTDIAATSDPATGLLESFTRTVTTDLAGDKRLVIEEWTLAPAA